jgi:hypothetical protein
MPKGKLNKRLGRIKQIDVNTQLDVDLCLAEIVPWSAKELWLGMMVGMLAMDSGI